MSSYTRWPNSNNCYVYCGAKGYGCSLCFDVVKNLQHLYTMYLMDINSSELQLNGGRFEYFTFEEQEYSINLPFNYNGQEFKAKFTELVNWIAEHEGIWTFTIKPESVGMCSIDFGFENATTAVAFKMVWF